MRLQESGEMYLECIFVLTQQRSKVRSIDVCEYMGYSKPSVSRAVGLLKKGGYITVDEEGYLSLTDMGIESAKRTYERHKLITKLLMACGVDEKTASEDACRIEHVISEESFNALKKHFDE